MIILILFLSLILRLVNLDQSLWLDEGSQVLMSKMSLSEIIFHRQADFHPPLSYILFHFWIMLGESEIWVRMLSVLFGVGTVFGVYKIGKYLVDEKFALFASLLMAVAPYHIYYSQEARMYSMAAFLATWSTYFLLINHRVGFILTTVSLLLTHYLGFFILAPQAIYIFIHRKEDIKKYLQNMFFILLLWIPWFPQFLEQLKSGVNANDYLPGWANVLSLSLYKSIPLTFLKFSIGRIEFENVIIYGSVALLVFITFGGLLLLSIKEIRNRQLLFYWFLIPLIIAWIVSIKIPIFQPFRLLIILPAFYLLIALGIFSLNKLKTFIMVIVISLSIIFLSFYYLDPKFWREDWRSATNLVQNNIKDDGIAIFAWPESFDPFKIYSKGVKAEGVITSFPANEEEVNEKLNRLANYKEFFLFGYLQDLSDPNRYTQKWFYDNGYQEIKVYDFRGVGFVYQFRRF